AIEPDAVLDEATFVFGTGVIESRPAFHVKSHLPADHVDAADQLIRDAACSADRHVVFDLADAVIVQEASDEDVGVWPVELFAAQVLGVWSDAESAAFAVVEDGGKYAW